MIIPSFGETCVLPMPGIGAAKRVAGCGWPVAMLVTATGTFGAQLAIKIINMKRIVE